MSLPSSMLLRRGPVVPSVQSVSVCRRATRAGRLAVQAIGEATQLRDPAWTKDMIAKFKASDINNDGIVDRVEFGRLAESTGNLSEFSVFRWLSEKDVDDLFKRYADAASGGITFKRFLKLTEDGVLLTGKLNDYKALFDGCQVSEDGTIGGQCIYDLGAKLEAPLSEKKVADLIDTSAEGLKAGTITFPQFLNIFREHLLDLDQIMNYIRLEDAEPLVVSPEETKAAKELVPDLQLGVPFFVESSEQFDACMALHPDRLVVLLAGLTWCRPCKALSRPYEKLGVKYPDAVFLKVYGDTNDNTKRFFKSRLQVKATPHLSFHRNGQMVYSRTGANKGLIELNIRRFYRADVYPMEEDVLYPVVEKKDNSKPPALM